MHIIKYLAYMSRRWIYILPVYLLVPLICISCFGPDNRPPVIEKIILDPAVNHTPGSDIMVSAIVTDADGDPLTYLWESEGGLIRDPLQLNASWELFTTSEPLSYEEIRLTVSDGKEAVTSRKTIQVDQGLIVTGYVYYQGTIIPVPGVEVSIGKFTSTSDQNGFYAISHLKEGSAVITARKEGFDMYEKELYVDFLKSVYHIPMTSPTFTSRVSGIIRTDDGVAREGLRVVLLNSDQTESKIHSFTDAGGFYSISGVPQGNRSVLVKSEKPETHFLDDSLVFNVNLSEPEESRDARIKIRRTIIRDVQMSGYDLWEFQGDTIDGFYLLDKGTWLQLREPIHIPEDAEKATVYLRSFIVGGCDMVGQLPSHRVWISDPEGKYLGGISWGGEGTNYPAEVSWVPSSSPTFLDIYGKDIRLHLELFEGTDCVPDPYWRVYEIGFSYYH